MSGTHNGSPNRSVSSNKQGVQRSVKTVFRDGVLEQYGSVVFRDVRSSDPIAYAYSKRAQAIQEAKNLHELDIALGLVPNTVEDSSNMSEREKQKRSNRLAYLHNTIGNKAFQECLRDLYVGYKMRLVSLNLKRSQLNHENQIAANKLAIVNREIARRKELIRRCEQGPSKAPRHFLHERSPHNVTAQPNSQVHPATNQGGQDDVLPEVPGQASRLTYGQSAVQGGVNHHARVQSTPKEPRGQNTSAGIFNSSLSPYRTNQRTSLRDNLVYAQHMHESKDLQSQGVQERATSASQASISARGHQASSNRPLRTRLVQPRQANTTQASQASSSLPAQMNGPQETGKSAAQAEYLILPAGQTVRGGLGQAEIRTYQALSPSAVKEDINRTKRTESAIPPPLNPEGLRRIFEAFGKLTTPRRGMIYDGQKWVPEGLYIGPEDYMPPLGRCFQVDHPAPDVLYDAPEPHSRSTMPTLPTSFVESVVPGSQEEDEEDEEVGEDFKNMARF